MIKWNAIARRLLPTAMLERWPHVCQINITFENASKQLVRSHKNDFDKIICILGSTEDPRSFQRYQSLPEFCWTSTAVRCYISTHSSYLSIHTNICICIYTYVYIYMYIHIYICIYTYVYIYIYMYIYRRIYMYMYSYIYRYIHIHI